MTSTSGSHQRLKAPIRVLLVEDDPGLRDVLGEILTTAEMVVETAADGAEAWDLLKGDPLGYATVVTDRIMPRVDGMELLGKIKASREMALLPVIIITVAARPQDMVNGFDAGAYSYISKPVDADVLVSMIRSAAADWQHVQELNRHIRSDTETLNLTMQARFEFRSPDQAMGLGALLAKTCPDPDRIVMGLSELLVNAVEHGNLEIGYDEKGRLLQNRTWKREVEKRLATPGFGDRVATVEIERTDAGMVFTIRDQGRGFEPTPYLEIDPSRVMDGHGRGIAMARLLSFDDLRYEDGGRRAIAIVKVED